MRFLKSCVLAMAVAAASIVPTLAASPDGVWELETRDTRIELNVCGDGRQLCGALVWLKDTDYNVQYQPLLHKPMMERVTQSAPNEWRGKMKLFGMTAQGTITQVSEDQLTLKGCVLIVACKTYQMYRYAE
jgi:uncharacterized protein (DUF2147 family)